MSASCVLLNQSTGKPVRLTIKFDAMLSPKVLQANQSIFQKMIADAAEEFDAVDGDVVHISSEGKAFKVSIQHKPKMWDVGTTARSMMDIAKHLAAHSDYKSNDIFRNLIAAKDRLTDEFIAAVCGKMCKVLNDDKPKNLVNRPKTHRHQGNCYKNALDEFRETGNEACICLEAVFYTSGIAVIVPHAINYNKAKNEYYDTQSDSQSHKGNRMCWVCVRGEELMKWYEGWEADWRSVPAFSNTLGGYQVLWVEDKLITIKSLGIDCPRTGAVKTYLEPTIEPLAPLAVDGMLINA